MWFDYRQASLVLTAKIPNVIYAVCITLFNYFTCIPGEDMRDGDEESKKKSTRGQNIIFVTRTLPLGRHGLKE